MASSIELWFDHGLSKESLAIMDLIQGLADDLFIHLLQLLLLKHVEVINSRFNCSSYAQTTTSDDE